MWRVQVWEEDNRIAEAFLVDDEAQAVAKRDELWATYEAPRFDVRIEKTEPRMSYESQFTLGWIATTVLNPLNFLG